MPTVKFIKNHPSNRFKKGDKIDIPKESLAAWIKSGYIETEGNKMGNVEALKDGQSSKKSSVSGGKSQKKLSKNKKKRK